ncbi:hypothetical protein ABPG72_003128, partial [Tetrahymena utriculariae]
FQSALLLYSFQIKLLFDRHSQSGIPLRQSYLYMHQPSIYDDLIRIKNKLFLISILFFNFCKQFCFFFEQKNNLYVRIVRKQDGTKLQDTSSTFSLLTDSVIQNMNNLNSFSIKDDIQDFYIDNSYYFFWNRVQYQNQTGFQSAQAFIVDVRFHQNKTFYLLCKNNFKKQNRLFLGSCQKNLMYIFNVNLNIQHLTLSNQYPQPSGNTSYSDILSLDPQINQTILLLQSNYLITEFRPEQLLYVGQFKVILYGGFSIQIRYILFKAKFLVRINHQISLLYFKQMTQFLFKNILIFSKIKKNYFIVDQQINIVSQNTQGLAFSNIGQLPKQYLPSHAYNYSKDFIKRYQFNQFKKIHKPFNKKQKKRTYILIELNSSGNVYLFMSMDFLICGKNSYLNQQQFFYLLIFIKRCLIYHFLQNRAVCITCNENQILKKNQQCSPCSSNCKQCDSFSQCKSCIVGYYLSNSNQCVELNCPDNSSLIDQICVCNSNYFQQTDRQLQICQIKQKLYHENYKLAHCQSDLSVFNVLIHVKIDDYYLKKDTCTKCQALCLTYGYYISGSLCIKWLSPCLKCSSSSSCSSCSSEYFLDQNKKFSKCQQNCVKCQDSQTRSQYQQGYFLDIQSQNCQLCTNNCNTCSSSTFCLNCLPGYYLSGNSCSQCSNICSQCTSTQSCSSCKDGYFLYSDQSLSCDNSCSKCSSLTKCSVCSNGYYLDTSNQYSQTCSQCQTGYFLDISSRRCTQCINNCQTCSSLTQLLSCLPGYQLSGSSCFKCINFCSQCTSNQICPSSIDDYFLVNNSCQKCIQNCTQCQDCQSCTQCYKGYNYQGNLCLTSSQCPTACQLCQDNTSCQTCLEGYVNQNQQCIKCSVENCSICDNQQYCQQCKSGFKLLHQRQTCIKNCQVGYYLSDNNQCLACDQSCQSCQGPKDTDFMTCKINLYLSSFSQKFIQCEDKQYLDNQHNCQKCFSLCYTCNGSSSNQSKSCINQLVKSNLSHQCITQDEFQVETIQYYFQNGFECSEISDKNVKQKCEDQLEFSKFTYTIYFYVSAAGITLSLFSVMFVNPLKSVSQYFIQTQQMLGFYIFSQKLVPQWLNQMHFKISYSYNIFTLAPNFITLSQVQHNLSNLNEAITLNIFLQIYF